MMTGLINFSRTARKYFSEEEEKPDMAEELKSSAIAVNRWLNKRFPETMAHFMLAPKLRQKIFVDFKQKVGSLGGDPATDVVFTLARLISNKDLTDGPCHDVTQFTMAICALLSPTESNPGIGLMIASMVAQADPQKIKKFPRGIEIQSLLKEAMANCSVKRLPNTAAMKIVNESKFWQDSFGKAGHRVKFRLVNCILALAVQDIINLKIDADMIWTRELLEKLKRITLRNLRLLAVWRQVQGQDEKLVKAVNLSPYSMYCQFIADVGRQFHLNYISDVVSSTLRKQIDTLASAPDDQELKDLAEEAKHLPVGMSDRNFTNICDKQIERLAKCIYLKHDSLAMNHNLEVKERAINSNCMDYLAYLCGSLITCSKVCRASMEKDGGFLPDRLTDFDKYDV